MVVMKCFNVGSLLKVRLFSIYINNILIIQLGPNIYIHFLKLKVMK
jgi:hypothetical protein